MTLYKRPETTLWQYEFLGGKRYRGITKTADQVEARHYEIAQRLEIQTEAAHQVEAVKLAVQRSTLWNTLCRRSRHTNWAPTPGLFEDTGFSTEHARP